MHSHRKSRRSGSALMLVIWAMFLLLFAVIAWVEWIEADISALGRANREVEALTMARSGMEIALHPIVTKYTPWLEEQITSTAGYRVRMVSEGSKLNVNWLISGGAEDQGLGRAKMELFKRWLELKGLDYQQRDAFVDCLMDWIDPDDAKRLNGVENEGDYLPPNRGQLQTIEEIADVANSSPLTDVPGWMDQLTLYSQGPIDLTAAQPDILRLIPGMSEARIQAFINIRNGRDAIEGTLDDFQFKNLEEVRRLMGMGTQEWQSLSGLIGLNDPTQLIISEGISGKHIRQLEVVVRKAGASPSILSWKE